MGRDWVPELPPDGCPMRVYRDDSPSVIPGFRVAFANARVGAGVQARSRPGVRVLCLEKKKLTIWYKPQTRALSAWLRLCRVRATPPNPRNVTRTKMLGSVAGNTRGRPVRGPIRGPLTGPDATPPFAPPGSPLPPAPARRAGFTRNTRDSGQTLHRVFPSRHPAPSRLHGSPIRRPPGSARTGPRHRPQPSPATHPPPGLSAAGVPFRLELRAVLA